MGREHKSDNVIRQIIEGRAARILAVAGTVFLCVFTLFEFAALRMEWDVPVLEAMSGENGFGREEYQREELELDDSTENVLLQENTESTAEEPEDVGATEYIETTEENETETVDAAKPEFPYYICINRKQNCITVYTMDETGEYTVPYKAMVCSTGLYNATPRGTYQISTKYLWRELFGGVYGQYATRICGGVLFHSVPYYSKSKNSLCTDKYNKLGQQASMGCVRLTVEDAKWIAENCPEGTIVEIYDDEDPGPLGKPEAVKIDPDSPNKGWDPTDPDEDNPWHELSEDE